ncbi:hypothetical protein BDA99DRAFT_193033 [Phascolomyces articulosus]|uniref:Chromo domain-containing protein n=1 Tax=Phascolomyces articulosus TaxID=60185 RepID=A0AAD5KA01_9FUNG|nr:hypothetical protein BDA99DRAFT_193033 [Phascolomyces articulosus]
MLNDYDKEEEEEEEEEGYLNGNGSDGDQLIPSYNKHHNIPTLNSDRSSNSSSSSSHSKRRYLEPEDVDSIYGDYLNNDEGSTSKNPFVIDSVSDRTSNNSSVSINKRRRTSENTRPLPPIEQPKRSQRQQPHYEEKNKDDHEEEDDDYDDVSEEKYEVEEILAHKVYRNRVVKYEIKWVGYSNKHNTWEPASSVHEDCPKICAKYWSKHEPRPINAPTNSTSKQPQQQQHKKSDASNKQESYIKRLENHNITDEDLHVSLKNQGFHIAYGSGFPTKSTDWMLEMRQIHLVQKVEGTDQILAYVSWANRKKTVHVVQELHDKCPGELISYYEARIRFED